MSLPLIDHFDPSSFHARFNTWPCPDCGGGGALFIGPGAAQNYAKIECLHCGHFHGWMPRPRAVAEQKARRTSRPRLPAGSDYCWICNRDAATLDSLGVPMDWAHKRDRAALIDAGLEPDGEDDMRVCKECHGMIDQRRSSVSRMTTHWYDTWRQAVPMPR